MKRHEKSYLALLLAVIIAGCSDADDARLDGGAESVTDRAAESAGPVSPFRIETEGIPASVVETVRGDLEWGTARIEEMFGPFPGTATARIFPHRAGFSDALRDAWGIPETACWMVGAADDHSLYLLSPDVWGEEACEHDPSDAEHRRLLIAHEAVHVFHGQVNPSEDIGLLEELGWFVEGLATYVSGQLEADHKGRAAESIATGQHPESLSVAWSGPYRYGVTGSMVAYIDEIWGRDTLAAALECTMQDALFALLGATEEEFLAGWRDWVAAAG